MLRLKIGRARSDHALPAASPARAAFLFATFAALGLSLTDGAMAAQGSVQDQLPIPGFRWLTVFSASPTDPQPGVPTTNSDSTHPIFTNQTIRQVVHLSMGTQWAVRIHLSNALSSTPITLADVHVAQWAGSASNPSSAIVAGSDLPVSFNYGQTSVTIPAYGEVVSDSTPFAAGAQTDAVVSVYVPAGNTTPATQHFLGNTNVYYVNGDVSGATVFSNAGVYSGRPYVSAVDVAALSKAATIVTLGDSITDGAYTTADGNTRWPDVLGQRLQAAFGNMLGISNAGVGTGSVLTNSYGLSMVARVGRDVLTVPGAKYVILFAGVNDIVTHAGLTAEQLEAGYREIIARCHEMGLYVYGGTITPFGGSFVSSTANEQLRQALNTFIRSSGAYDGVIDFDKALADPSNPTYIRAAYNTDYVHPNNAGYQAMGNAINLSLFDPSLH